MLMDARGQWSKQQTAEGRCTNEVYGHSGSGISHLSNKREKRAEDREQSLESRGQRAEDREEKREKKEDNKGVPKTCMATWGSGISHLYNIQECYKSVTSVLQVCYKCVTRVLQECYESVTPLYQRNVWPLGGRAYPIYRTYGNHDWCP
jgi:hypothetical protein